jgi:hypothetical protein
MKTVRRLLHGEIVRAVSFVLVGFLALFLFFDVVDELQNLANLASQGYKLHHALLFVALKTPSHIYELMPISVLIGCIFVMARLAQSSEFTILRTGGLTPLKALSTLLQLGLVFVFMTLLIGDYVAPWADRQGVLVKAPFQGNLTVGRTGAWLKERQDKRHFAVNVRSFDGISHMQNIRIHEFNEDGQLVAITSARQADFGEGEWRQNNPIPVPSTCPIVLAHGHQCGHGDGCGAQSRPHEDLGTVQLHAAFVQQQPKRSALRNRVLAESFLPFELPGDAVHGIAICLRALSVGSNFWLCLWWCLGWHQFCAFEQSIWPRRQLAKLAAMADSGGTVIDLQRHFFVGFLVVGITTMTTGLNPETGVILFAHGSRDPLWRLPIDAVALNMKQRWPNLSVACAFLELTTPDLNTTVETLMMEGKTHMRIVPMFLGVGRHAREDLPRLVEDLANAYPQVQFELVAAIGEHPAMTQLMADIAAAQSTKL